MRKDCKYILHLVDGEVIRGTYIKEERGFYLLKSDGIKRVARKASVKRIENG